ncbi:uncharacterized protein LOC141853395 [Brevipalpus obovatus]|uniref:uncharacterized protein LOC141853395 n=1 Tax=Brevipalpus obovatus TaxID=246614 RepID=UPI003D9F6840
MQSPVASSLPDESAVSPCDTISFIYLCLALTLFAGGSIVTLLSTEESRYFAAGFVHFWFLGPLCLCCGLMIAFKALMHIRKKTLIEYLTRQAISSATEDSDPNYYSNRTNNAGLDNISVHSLPPPYEQVIASSQSYFKKEYV